MTPASRQHPTQPIPSSLRPTGMVAAATLTLALVVVPSLTPTAAAAPTTVLYASPDGGGDCSTVTSPCSLPVAEEEVAEAVADGPVELRLAGGTYRLSDAFDVPSGAPGRTVTITSAEEDLPLLSGAEAVPGADWTDVTARGFDLTTVAANYDTAPSARQLWVNGRRAQRAQGPAVGWRYETIGGQPALTAPAGTVDTWDRPDAAEVVWTGGQGEPLLPGQTSVNGNRPGIWGWAQSRCGIAGWAPHEPGRIIVEIDEPCFSEAVDAYTYYGTDSAGNVTGKNGAFGPPDRIENAPELIDEPGEFAMLPAPGALPGCGTLSCPGDLLYAPLPTETMSDAAVEFPILDTLVRVTGSQSQPATGVRLGNLTFAHTTWRGPDEPTGFVELQANAYLPGAGRFRQENCLTDDPPGSPDPVIPGCPYAATAPRPPAAVELTDVRDVQIYDSRFVALGTAALDLSGVVDDVDVLGNEFDDVSSTGIWVGDTTPSTRVREVTMTDNSISRVGQDYAGAHAVVVTYARDVTIANNVMEDLPAHGINIGWGAGYDNTTPALVGNHRVVDNVVRDFAQVLCDTGALYTQGPQSLVTDPSDPQGYATGLVVSGNVFRDSNCSTNLLFLDEGTRWVTAEGNALFYSLDDQASERRNFGGTNFRPTGQNTAGNWRITGNWYDSNVDFISYDGALPTFPRVADPADNIAIDGPQGIPATVRDAAGPQGFYRDGLTPTVDILRSSPGVTLSPAWTECLDPGSCLDPEGSLFGQSSAYTDVVNQTATVPFDGTGVRLYAGRGPENGSIRISVPGCPTETLSLHSPIRQTDSLVWTSCPLPDGPHVLTVTALGAVSAQDGPFAELDRISVLQQLGGLFDF